MSVEHVEVLDGEIDVRIRRTDSGIEIHVDNKTSYPIELLRPSQWMDTDAAAEGEVYSEKVFSAYL